jgi:hypothetical protein
VIDIIFQHGQRRHGKWALYASALSFPMDHWETAEWDLSRKMDAFSSSPFVSSENGEICGLLEACIRIHTTCALNQAVVIITGPLHL